MPTGPQGSHVLTSMLKADGLAIVPTEVDVVRAGEPLGRALPGRIGLEIRAIVAGGLAILDKIEAVEGDVFRHRPVLRRLDWARVAWRALTR